LFVLLCFGLYCLFFIYFICLVLCYVYFILFCFVLFVLFCFVLFVENSKMLLIFASEKLREHHQLSGMTIGISDHFAYNLDGSLMIKWDFTDDEATLFLQGMNTEQKQPEQHPEQPIQQEQQQQQQKEQQIQQ
jgi:sensor histidine kinase YesM